MGFFDDAWNATKRVGLGIATGGLSEGMGARPVLDAAAGNGGGLQDLLLGGKATAGIDAKPQNYDYATGQLQQIASGSPYRAAPRVEGTYRVAGTQLDPSQMAQSRAGLMGTADSLGRIASGQQAGAGELAVNRQVGQATAAQTAAARMAHGANSALALRNAARNTADLGLQGAGAAAQAQMADQQAANMQRGQLYGQAYGQDANVAGQNATLGQSAQLANAQFGQQSALANQSAQLQQTQLNDARQIQSLGQMLGWDQARINAELAKAGIAAQDKGILPGLLQGAGQIGAAYATGGLSAAAPAAGMMATGGGGPITSPGQLDPLAAYRRPAY